MKRRILGFVLVTLSLSACGTYNNWTPDEKQPQSTRPSCTNGMLDCHDRN
ncbi:hypothetical protein OSJ77_11645 [Phyllobacterium sp. 0TCS1.6C]|nr:MULTISPECIES: hypothetical protein [unclassified Phyllobacterium]MCX8280847.1 hypothetical protein [Phyllobacterium sp. 0TCS1.6C]MCX8295713.1 hypothetical protein [Phyllobacterium sp. 0TCS1.6A]